MFTAAANSCKREAKGCEWFHIAATAVLDHEQRQSACMLPFGRSPTGASLMDAKHTYLLGLLEGVVDFHSNLAFTVSAARKRKAAGGPCQRCSNIPVVVCATQVLCGVEEAHEGRHSLRNVKRQRRGPVGRGVCVICMVVVVAAADGNRVFVFWMEMGDIPARGRGHVGRLHLWERCGSLGSEQLLSSVKL